MNIFTLVERAFLIFFFFFSSFSFWPRFSPRGGPDSWSADGPRLPFSFSPFYFSPYTTTLRRSASFFRSRINHVLGSGNGTTVANSGEISCATAMRNGRFFLPRDPRLFISLFASNSGRDVTRIVTGKEK